MNRKRHLSRPMRAARWLSQVAGMATRGEFTIAGEYDRAGRYPRRDRPYHPRRWKLARALYFGPNRGARAHVVATLFFQPSDLWLGVYWDWTRCGSYAASILKFYVCVLPCLPIELMLWEARQDRERIR